MKTRILIFLQIILAFTINGQWAQTNGPEGGTVASMRIVGNKVFAAIEYSGLHVSTDNGDTWNKINIPLTTSDVRSLAVIGTSIFVATGDGIFVSSDYGVSWSPANTGLPPIHYSNFIIENGSDLFADVGGNLYLSTDSGASWSIRNNGILDIVVEAMTFDGSNIYCGSVFGVFKSTDNGGSWTPVNNGLPGVYIYVLSMANNGSNIIVGTMANGIYISNDSGATWVTRNNNLLSPRITSLKVVGNTIYAGTGGGGLYFSNNNGLNWTPINSGLPQNWVKAIEFVGTDMIIGTIATGIFVSSDSGASWTSKSKNIIGTIVRSLATMGNFLFAGTDRAGVSVTNDKGVTWSPLNFGLAHTVVWALAVCGTNLYAGTNDGVYLSTDSAKTWTDINTDLSALVVNALAVSGNNIYAGTQYGNGFSVLVNGQSVWTPMKAGLTTNDVHAILADGSNVVALTGGAAFYSTNNAAYWNIIPGTQGLLNWKSVIKHNGEIYAANYNHGLYHVASDFSSVSPVSSFPNIYVSLLEENGNAMFAWSDKVYSSYDNAATWDSMNTGLENQTLRALIASGQDLYAGTFGKGVYTISAPVSVEQIDTRQTKNTFVLLSNPAKDFFSLQFLNDYKEVRFEIYNVTGQKIYAEDVLNVSQGSLKEINLNLSTGVYIVKVICDDVEDFRKFLVE